MHLVLSIHLNFDIWEPQTNKVYSESHCFKRLNDLQVQVQCEKIFVLPLAVSILAWMHCMNFRKIFPISTEIYLFPSRVDSLIDANIKSMGVLPSIYVSLHKYKLFHYLELWFRESTFLHIHELKNNCEN